MQKQNEGEQTTKTPDSLAAVLVCTVEFCAPSTMKLLPVIRAARSETRNPTISVLPSNYAAAFMNSLWIVQDFLTTVWL